MKCKTCNSLKLEIEDFNKTLSKFIKDRENLQTTLSNQRDAYNKIGLNYKLDNNTKSFKNIYLAKKT